MPRGEVLDHGRSPRTESRGDAIEVIIGAAPVLAFSPLMGRVSTCLVMPGIDRLVDVSVSPRTALLTMRQAADQRGLPGSQAEAITRRSLNAAIESAEAWAPCLPLSGVTLAARIGGAAFPLLGAAYDEGAKAIDEVPRWGAAILAACTARDGARVAFGSAATRPVITAMARSLTRVEGDPVDLSRLAFALIASDVLEPDRLARVLTLGGQSWPVRHLPEPHVIDDGRRAAARWGAQHAERYLAEACAQEDGLIVLIDCIRYTTDLGAHGPGRLPANLNDLHALYRSRFTTPPATPNTQRRPRSTRPPTNDQTTEPDEPSRGTQRPTRNRVDYGLRIAPEVSRSVQATPQDRIPHPAWLRAIDGATFDEFRIALPGACGDLNSWSRALRNCLNSYNRAAKAGQSHLIGVESDGRLRYVVEVTPQHRIRQFAGHANRMPSVDHHDRIVAFLAQRRIVR